jgi:glycosyltransferase involved in cell wall biosynthesis
VIGANGNSTAALADQVRRGFRVWRTSGPKGAAQRVARAVYQRLDAGVLEFPLLLDDIADSRQLQLPVPVQPVDRARPLRVGWISTPPAFGSGGHTTMFRMLSALEDAGHQCTIFLYDRYNGNVSDHEATIRRVWPWVRARVTDTRNGLGDVDACVATAWPTAHVLARRARAPMRRLYLVQDFEPFFFPRGAEYALAEDSYRFGFRSIAVGHMVANLLRDRIGIPSDVVEFGCDNDVYRLGTPEPRNDVVFYARPRAARRGFLLGLLAVQELHRRRPDVAIHFVGAPGVRAPFPAIHHGVRSPADLAALYNRTVAGVALSFTNISLLADELLACGTVPVVNDSPYARADVVSEYVRWAPPTPSGIAHQLVDVLDSPPDPARVADSARHEVWRPAQAAFVRAVEDETYGR